MSRILSRASIQTQIGLALGVIGLVFCGSLIGAVISADVTQRTFADVADRRLPAIFSSLTAKEHAAELNSRFEELISAETGEALAAADRATQTSGAEIRTVADGFADAEAGARILAALQQADAARVAAAEATAARISADAATATLWRDMQALHEKLTGDLANRADEATFDLILRAESAKERLVSSVSTLANADVEKLMLLMRLQAVLAEIEGVLIGLDAASDAASRAALVDRLESGASRLDALLAEAPADLATREGLEKISELLALAADPTKRFAYARAGGAEAVFELKRAAQKALADQTDEANFMMVLSAEELSASTGDEVDALAGAMTGEFRRLLDASAVTHLALGRVAQAVSASDADAVTVLENGSGTLLAKLSEFAGDPTLAAFQADLTALSAVLGGDQNAFDARRAQLAAEAAAEASALAGKGALASLNAELQAIAEVERGRIQNGMAEAGAQVISSRNVQLIVGAVCLLTILAVALLFIRPRIVAPLRAFRVAVARLARGEKVALPGMERGDEIGALARSMEEIYERGVEAARIRIALDNSSALMMIADDQHRIQYVNSGLLNLFRANVDAIREQLPAFDPDTLVGSEIDVFHSAPEQRRAAIDGLNGPHQGGFKLGGRDFTLSLNPVTGEQGERLGTVVEWRDMTVELRVQEQIDRAVGAAVDGDFSGRIEVEGASGQLRSASEKINALLSSVETGVADTSRAIEALAQGDLTHRMSGAHRGAFETLQNNVNGSVAKLSEVVGAINSAAHRISMRTDQIRDGASQLSARAEGQASTLEETAATMEEITATTKESASSASKATSIARTALSGAEKSGMIVGEAVEAMGRIETSAARISEIINVIDSIAFQTNLLALNAAVEAARAGDAGKGFAVVAAEVRALAQRAGDAAKDIRGLIEASGTHVAAGVERVNQTGGALTQIIDEVKLVAERIDEISRAASEQASGIEEITSAVNSMDETTQHNSSMAEESASGASELAKEAQQLVELVAHFRADAAAGAAPALIETTTPDFAPAPAPAPEQAVPPAPTRAASAGDWSDF